MLRHFIALSLVVLASNTAWAVHNTSASTSEFFHQTDAGRFELTPALAYTRESIDLKPTGSRTTSGWNISAMGEYGFNDMHSAGLLLSYKSWTTAIDPVPATNGEPSTSGLMDPNLFYNGHTAMGAGALHWGANLFLSLGKEKVDPNGNMNAYSGGTKLTPFVGWDTKAGGFNLGAQASFDLYRSDRTRETDAGTGTNTSTKYKNGQEWNLTAFGEMPMNQSLLGLSLGYTGVGNQKTDVAGTETDLKDAHTIFTGSLYGTHHLNENWELLPAFTYSTLTYNDSAWTNQIDNQSTWSLSLGARHGF